MIIDISSCTWTKSNRRLVVEASDLQISKYPTFLEVKGQKRTVTFQWCDVIRDPEGDLQVVIYSSTTENIELHILND